MKMSFLIFLRLGKFCIIKIANIMNLVKLKIKKIKNIKYADIELPFDGGIYGIIGTNGCGKSTLMLLLSVLTSPKRYFMLNAHDYDNKSSVYLDINIDGKSATNTWIVENDNKWRCKEKCVRLSGVYEGSLFYGTRFDNSRIVDQLFKNKKITDDMIVDADNFVKDNLSYILHGDRNNYRNLRRIKNKRISEKLNLINIPYFIDIENRVLISQYRMSSGECLLISLLNYIYYTLINQGTKKYQNTTPLILIDEIELALHPIAIKRLFAFLEELRDTYTKLVIYITSHSPEVIRAISPENMFLLKNDNGNLDTINPCFPSYAIRDVYSHDGYDILILVEDKLACYLVNNIISEHFLNKSKLIHVVPVGGYDSVLKLHVDLLANNVLGTDKKVISILDGDAKEAVSKLAEFQNLLKLYLPIPSIEKFLFEMLNNKKYPDAKKIINDKYFTLKSLDDLFSEFNAEYKSSPKKPDKKLYSNIKKDLKRRNIEESTFIEKISDDIKKIPSLEFDKFSQNLNKFINKI